MPEKNAIRDLMERVAAAGSLQEVYDSALSCLQLAVGVGRAAVLVPDDQGAMRFVAAAGLSDDYRRTVDGHSPWSAQDADPQPVLVTDVQAASELAAYLPTFEREHIRALAFVPLRFGPKLLGKFMLYYDEPHDFAPSEVTVAETIAGHIAFALEHRRIARELGARIASEQELRRSAEREVALRQENEKRLHLALAAGRMGAWSWDVASGRVEWSPELEAIHGIAPGTFAGTIDAFQQDMHPDDAARVHGAIERTLATPGSEYTVSYRILPPDGEMRWVEARGKVFHDAGGRAVRMLGICSDTSERKRLEEAAERARQVSEHARQQLQILAETTDDLASSLDPDAVLQQLAERAVEKLADYCVAYGLDGDRISRLGIAHRLREKRVLVQRLIDAGPPTIEDPGGAGYVIRTGLPILAENVTEDALRRGAQNETHLAALLQLAPRSAMVVPLEARGRTVGAIALATTDDSGRRYGAADLELAQALASRAALLVDNARLYTQARAALRARDDMIAVVSHDLRNPLQSISTAASLLRLDPSPERRGRHFESITVATAQMSRLLQDLLDISRMDAGEFAVTLDKVEVDALVDDARALFLPVAEERGIRLESVMEENLPFVRADRSRVLQVLANLLSNALKFAPRGGAVILSVDLRGGAVRFAVSDNGPGIRQEHQSKVFERFWRVSPDEKQGAGLGLAVAKGILVAHGGSIGVDSCEGQGSTFYFDLPVDDAAESCGEPRGESLAVAAARS